MNLKKWRRRRGLDRNGELSVTVLQPLSLVSTVHLQLYKSPHRTSQSKFLSIHAPSCLQAGTESGLEINASVNGFTLPLRFTTPDQTAPEHLSLRAQMLNGRENNPTSLFYYEISIQLQVSSTSQAAVWEHWAFPEHKNESASDPRWRAAQEMGIFRRNKNRKRRQNVHSREPKEPLCLGFAFVYL